MYTKNLTHLFHTVCEIITFKVDKKISCGKMQKADFVFLVL
jgi:hypothetical protein